MSIAPLTHIRSFHDIIWWWRLGNHRAWLTWTIRAVAIYGLVVFAGLLALLSGAGSGSKPRRSKRRKRRRSKPTKELPAWLFVIMIPAFAALAVLCTILAPILGLLFIPIPFLVWQDMRTPPPGGGAAT